MFSSVLSINSNSYELSWQSVLGKHYHVLFKSNLLDSIWQTNHNSVVGADGTTTVTNVHGGQDIFYKLMLE